MIAQACAECGVEYLNMDLISDILASQAFLVILDPELLSKEDFQMLDKFYREDDKETTVLLLGQSGKMKRFITSIPTDIKGWRLLILNARRQVFELEKKHRKYDQRLFRLFSIIKLAFLKRKLDIAYLQQEHGVSKKTVYRDLEILEQTYTLYFDRETKELHLLVDIGDFAPRHLEGK